MQIRQLDHAALIVRDLEKASWFYGVVLGLREVPRPHTFDFGGRWFQGPTFQIHVILAQDTTAPAGFPDAGEAAHSGRAHHLAFEVEHIEEAITHLQAHQIELAGGPQQRGDGVSQIYVYDPDRYLIELFAWDQPST